MEPFVYNGQPARVIFGSGTIRQLPEELDRLGLKRVVVLATPPREPEARRLAERLGDRAAGVYARATMHTPVEVTEDAVRVVQDLKADGLVAVGGGSTTGLAKAIALRTDLPQVVVPTTYAGSEMTPILGETRDGVKVTQSSPKVLPEVVIYDIDLTLSLPVAMSGASGLNAIAHAVEALYARERNPVISLMATEAIGALATALPMIAIDPGSREARGMALYGAWLCGICLGSVGMALHHKLCHTLGGSFDLPHAETHAIVLPHALAYNAPAVPDVMTRLRDVLGTDDPAMELYDLAGRVGARRALADIGMPESGIELATDRALSNPYWNPRPLERDALRGLIARAYAGERPRS
ncbi:maleylacetate reductase [Mesorhizobium sp. VK23B]|uniref:Maleylacetate reductase n=1 Tax=Mesorhizobium dulcispinae TaxID=3072316 RepID=A0ABU4XGF2_9HYPH|nr:MULTISPECIES: maleylacetate reductase [unclassified Mesorhizobium]MDX8465153.1 maleylacetate reductase [Mesorhizobium sp. VK23B]MDX8472629.1 maleylacetate reductase [Mesorhizobium sp. VK23A]